MSPESSPARVDRSVRVLRGSVADPAEDLAVTGALLEDVAETGRPAVRVWTPPRQVAFGRRDARASGYDRARRLARDRGYVPIERRVGGRAVAYTGTTVALVSAEPTPDVRQGIDDRYATALATVAEGLTAVDAQVVAGEPPRSFCPGAHSLSVAPSVATRTWPVDEATADGATPVATPDRVGGKLAGVAQRLQRGVAMTAAVVVLADADAIAGVLEPVYAALDVAFDPATVGSVAAAGGPDVATPVCHALEDAVVGDRPRSVETVA